MKQDYIPRPADTSEIMLPDGLQPLIEDMARNVHEIWAQNRLNDGWRHGDVRDDANKRHPCLVPYDELPECEKNYDRATSQETLKLIIQAGFVIERRK